MNIQYMQCIIKYKAFRWKNYNCCFERLNKVKFKTLYIYIEICFRTHIIFLGCAIVMFSLEPSWTWQWVVPITTVWLLFLCILSLVYTSLSISNRVSHTQKTKKQIYFAKSQLTQFANKKKQKK